MEAFLLSIATLALLVSPFLLFLSGSDVFDKKSFAIALIAGLGALFIPFFRTDGNATLILQMLLAQTLLFVSYVAVSRIRQRKSAFLLALASVASNGGWFMTMYVLSGVYIYTKEMMKGPAMTSEFVVFMLIIMAGILCGRLVGVQWMRWVETRFAVKTDSVGSPTLRKLDKHTVPALLVLLLVSSLGSIAFGLAPTQDIVIVTVLGFLQNGIYSINTRLANRNHPGWPVVTKILASVVFIVHWAYLLRYSAHGGNMPLALLVPYTVATVAGSNIGALMSMVFEDWLGINKPDAHVKEGKDFSHVTWHNKLLVGTAVLTALYLLFNETILAWFGLVPSKIVLPFPVFGNMEPAHAVMLILGGLIFFTNDAMFALMSRAGNRNNAMYHAVLCVILGFSSFWFGAFVILNARFLDLIPLAAFGGAIGQLYAQQFSIWMEKKLNSVMDP